MSVATFISVGTRSACGLAAVPTYGRPRSSPILGVLARFMHERT
jgi:hypothetical protein